MELMSIRYISKGLAVFVLLMASGCADRSVHEVGDVSSNDRLHGKSILIQGCVSVHRHGKAIVDCANDDLGISLDTNGLEGSPEKLKELQVLLARAAGPDSTVQVRVLLLGMYAGSGIGRPDNVFVASNVLDVAEVAR